MPPSRFLGLPWPAWGDTDRTLALARRRHEAMLCSCGCGQWAPLAHDPRTEDWWEVDDDVTCYAGAAIAKWQADQGQDAEPGQLIRLRLDDGYLRSRAPAHR